MRLAYFSPLPPQTSGVADYSATLLPFLARHAEVDLFVDPSAGAAATAPAATLPCLDYQLFQDPSVRARYDAVLYQLGDHPQHAFAYRTLLDHPGVIVLHEYVLHHLVHYLTQAQGDSNAYVAALTAAYGTAGRQHGLAVVAGRCAPDPVHYPLSVAAIRASRGVIVHSRYLLERVRREHPGVPVIRVPHVGFQLAGSDSAVADPAWARRRLGLASDHFLIGSFGRIARTKRIDVVLRAFPQVRARFPKAHYVIVCESEPALDLARLIKDLDLGRSVTLTGRVAEAELRHYLAAVDLGVNLRYPSYGETSGALLRLLGFGKPAIVSRTGAFVELPDACCVKVTPGPTELADLTEQICRLAASPRERRRMGAAASDWVARHHRPEDAALAYLDFLKSSHDREAIPLQGSWGRLLENFLADVLLDLDLDGASDQLLRQIVEPAVGLSAE